MALPTKIWISTTVHADPIILNNITSFARSHWDIFKSTYRDEWDNAEGTFSTTGLSSATTIPCIGEPGTKPSAPTGSAGDFANLKYVATDAQAHIAPRFFKIRCSGYVFALNSETIPDPTAPTAWSSFFTGVAATDIFTSVDGAGSPAVHGRVTGDRVVVVAGGGLPAGLSANTVYLFVYVSTTTFMLITESTGAVVNITTAGTTPNTITLIESVALPAKSLGLVYVPDEWEPAISTSDPSA
jgi:hypothetical protein